MIEGEDAKDLKNGESIRLLGIGIVKITDSSELTAEYISENAENIEKKNTMGCRRTNKNQNYSS